MEVNCFQLLVTIIAAHSAAEADPY